MTCTRAVGNFLVVPALEGISKFAVFSLAVGLPLSFFS